MNTATNLTLTHLQGIQSNTYGDYIQLKNIIENRLMIDAYKEKNIVKECFKEYFITNHILENSLMNIKRCKNGDDIIKIPFDVFNRKSFKKIAFTFQHHHYGSGTVIHNCYQKARLHFYQQKTNQYKRRFFNPLIDKFFEKIHIEIINIK